MTGICSSPPLIFRVNVRVAGVDDPSVMGEFVIEALTSGIATRVLVVMKLNV